MCFTGDMISQLQWPAMLLTVVSTWWVGCDRPTQRAFGFWCSLAGNAIWIIWAIDDKAWAIIVMQMFLAVFNIRGGIKNQET